MHDGLQIGVADAAAMDAPHSRANQVPRNGFGAFQFTFVLEFQLAGDRWHCGIHVRDAGNDFLLASARRALLGTAHHAFEGSDRQPLTDARSAIHALVFARLKRNFFHHLPQIIRDLYAATRIALHPGFLRSDAHSFFESPGVMRANLSADAVLQWSDDLSACGVVFRIRCKDEQNVKSQTQRVTLNLDITFLHDVEEAYLNFTSEIRKFVHGENAAIRARQEAVMNRQLVGEVTSAARRLDGVQIADDVRDGDIRRG